MVFGVLGGDTALDRVAAAPDAFLALDVDLIRIQRIALSDHDLGLNQVDTCDQLGNRVLYLDPRVHFNKVMVAFFIHQKLNGTGVAVIDRLCQLQSIGADSLTLFLADAE